MGRLIGIDYGRARIGVAYSDESKFLSSPLFVCKKQKKINYSFEEIKKKITPFLPIEAVIVGLPLLLNGKEGEMALEAKAFGNALAAYLEIPCIFWDERLSSSQAERLMKEGSLTRKERAGLSDTFAATLILQNYLDFSSRKSL